MKPSNPYSSLASVRLPQFNGAVAVFRDAMVHRFHAMSRKDGFLSSIKSHVIHEGRGTAIIRKDTERDDVEMKEASAEIRFSREEIEHFTMDNALAAIQEMAEQLGKHQSKTMFEMMDKVTQKSGNVVQGKGAMTNELIIETLSKMDHDFRDGRSSGISIVVSPEMIKHMDKLQDEFRSSPELQKKYNDMMAKKYDEYRDREMDRTLAG
jgi:hypothetical protein